MKKRLLCALLLMNGIYILNSQVFPEPCEIQVSVSYSVCIDPPSCFTFGASPSHGTPPYTYLWERDGSTRQFMTILGSDYNGTCEIVTVTDSKGCVAISGDRCPGPLTEPIAAPDTLIAMGETIDFDVSINDLSADTVDYILVQAPLHGSVVFNVDGTGTYTPSVEWCGPDYFHYLVSDDACSFSDIIIVSITNGPCGSILLGDVDCNEGCTGTAHFYQQGIFTPPLTYQWSNGNATETATELCQGTIMLTVTDALGTMEVYEAEVQSAAIEASIIGLEESCQYVDIELSPSFTQVPEGALTYIWSGTSIIRHPFDSIQSLRPEPDSLNLYQLILSSTNGCIDTAYHEILGHLAPDVRNIDHDRLICPMGTLTLDAIVVDGARPYQYSWTGPLGVQSNSPQLVWPNVTTGHNGRYTLDIIDANGCAGTGSENVSTIKDSLDLWVRLSEINFQKTYCQGSNFELDYFTSILPLHPDKVEWTGPNGFYSEEINPTLSNLTLDHAGEYMLNLIFCDNYSLRDTAELMIAQEAATIADVQITPPTGCDSNDGEVVVTMSIPPPYDKASLQWATGPGPEPNLNQNPFTLSGADAANNLNLTVTAGECITKQIIDIPRPDEAIVLTTDISCLGEDGTAKVLSPNAPQVSARWNKQDSGNDILRGLEVNNLSAGAYNVTITDSVTNCVYYESFTINPYLNFEVMPVDIPNCTDATGSLEIVAQGEPTQPVRYDWSNNFTGSFNTGLHYGWYSVTMTDGDGCQVHENVFLAPEESCATIISGNAYINYDCDCTVDGDDIAFPRLKICASNGNFKDCYFTDNTGYYELVIPFVGDYTVTAYPRNDYLAETCAPLNYTIGEAPMEINDANFFYCGDPVTDLAVYPFCNIARPGFEQAYAFDVYNHGLVENDTAILKVDLDDNLSIDNINPEPASFNSISNEITWDLRRLKINAKERYSVMATVNAMLGDTIITTAEITTINNTDVALANNQNFCEQIVVGSYDPNDKQVSPISALDGHIAETDTAFTYTLRFQNTGTDTAFTVILRDTLDENVFDLNSIQPRSSSHEYTLDVEGENILVFLYENINLPDSNRTFAGSQGFVTFDIDLKNGLPLGTKIENSAAIYFDFNDPVITNTTFQIITSRKDVIAPELDFAIYPNPTTGESTLSFDLAHSVEQVQIGLFSIDGQFIKSIVQNSDLSQGKHSFSFHTDSLTDGLYFIQVRTEIGVFTKKLMKIE